MQHQGWHLAKARDTLAVTGPLHPCPIHSGWIQLNPLCVASWTKQVPARLSQIIFKAHELQFCAGGRFSEPSPFLSCLQSTSAAAHPMCSALLFIQMWLTFHLPFKKQQQEKKPLWKSDLCLEFIPAGDRAVKTRWYTRFGMLRAATGTWGEHKGDLLEQKVSPWSHLTLPYAQPCKSSRNGRIQTSSAFRALLERCPQWADVSHSFTAVSELNCYVAFIVILRTSI